MSKPIRLTDKMKSEMQNELLQQLIEKFKESVLQKDALDSLAKAQMSDGEFKFLKEFKYEKKFEYKNDERRVTIHITPDTYAKMITIIMANSDEVGWHYTTERLSDTEFVLTNLYLYPQEVTAATVDTDDREYAQWLMDLDKIDENIFPNLHGHGHSHVNMGVSPSGVDMGHRNDIISQLTNEDYYIFMIWNKRLEWSASVYDLKSNTLFESKEVDVVVEFGDGTTAGDVIEDIKKNVKKHTYGGYTGTPYTTGGYKQYSGAQTSVIPINEKKKEPEKKWWEKEREVGGVGNGLDNFPWERQQYGYYGGRGWDW